MVDAANAVLAGSGSTSVRLRAQRPSGPKVRYTPAADEVAEADAVADAAGGLIRGGTPASKIAVLFRINAQSEAFEEALASRGLPYVVRGATRFFERPEVRQAVTLLRGAVAQRRRVRPAARSAASHAGRHGLDHRGTRPTRGQTRDRWESLQALMTRPRRRAR